jgi:zinc protease
MLSQTKHVSAPEVASLFVSELRRLTKEPVPETELVPRKASLLGNFARRLETNEGLRDYVVDLALTGSPLDEANRFTAAVQAVDGDAVRSFAGTRLDATGASLVVVGNAAEFLQAIRRDFPHVEVVPLEQLDLDALGLRRATSQ